MTSMFNKCLQKLAEEGVPVTDMQLDVLALSFVVKANSLLDDLFLEVSSGNADSKLKQDRIHDAMQNVVWALFVKGMDGHFQYYSDLKDKSRDSVEQQLLHIDNVLRSMVRLKETPNISLLMVIKQLVILSNSIDVSRKITPEKRNREIRESLASILIQCAALVHPKKHELEMRTGQMLNRIQQIMLLIGWGEGEDRLLALATLDADSEINSYRLSSRSVRYGIPHETIVLERMIGNIGSALRRMEDDADRNDYKLLGENLARDVMIIRKLDGGIYK